MYTRPCLKAIFQHERRLFRADRLTLLLACIVFAAIGYALASGHAWAHKQQQAVNAAQKEERERLQKMQGDLSAMSAGKPAPASAAQNPANAYWVGSRYGASYAIMSSAALAAIAVGQSDLNPPYIKVSTDNKASFALNEEIENPSNLLIGHFDLAFVEVFLLPLLIIALAYNLLSAEREQGTLGIIMTNPVSLQVLLAGKVAFRVGLVFALMLSASLAGLIVIGTDLSTMDSLLRLGWWIALLLAYILFWFALAIAVNVLAKSSAQNALILTGLWIAILLVLPALINIGVNVAYPVPSRVAMVGLIRATQTDASKEYDAMDARFQQEHPEMTAKPVARGDDYAASRKRVLVQQAAAERTAQIMAHYDDQLAQQHRVVDSLRFLSPAILLQEALNHISGTDNGRYQHFSRQVDQFHREWQDFFLPKVLSNTPLTLADYAHFPRFRYVEQAFPKITPRLFGGLLGLMVPIGLLLFFSIRRLRDYPITA